MQHQVPQFIEIEDKMFGPLTFKQFLYLVGGGAICYLIWNFISIRFVAMLVILPVAGFFIALAFYNYNGRPFIATVENYFKYILGSKLYLWKKAPKEIKEKEADGVVSELNLPKISDSKLKDLTWSLDINSKISSSANVDKKSGLDLKF